MREVAGFQHPGSFADMDMLEIGNGNMTLNEQQTHMAFWAALKSPLIIGADITKLSNQSLDVLKNERVIAVSQDSLGMAALFVPELSVEHQTQVWSGPLSNNRTVLLVLNELKNASMVTIPLSKVSGSRSRNATSAQELWSGTEVQVVGDTLYVSLEQHQTKMYIF